MAISLVSVKLLMGVYATAGDLDPSFGNGGKLEGGPNIDAIAIQADGKLLALGRSQNENCQLSRFNLDGSLDPTFGTGGQVETNFGGFFRAAAIAIQPNGRIVIAGTKQASALSPKIVLARYKTDGSLDSTFSDDGMVEIPHLTAFGWDMALQSDGKIVIAGTVVYQIFPYPIQRSLIVRLNQDGALDSSFATSGYLVTNIWGTQPNQAEGFSDLAIQGNGKIVASAHSIVYSRLVRFFANGERDMSFGSGGAYDSAQLESNGALALQPDGKIVIAVNGISPSNYYGLLVRLSPDGIPDDTFGQGGKTVADPLASWSALGLQEDGRLVVAGGLYATRVRPFRLSRYQSDGSLDASFGSDGTVTTGFSNPFSPVWAMALYGDGRILVLGHTNIPNTNDTQSVLARYLNDDGTPAPADVRVAGESISPRIVNPGEYVTYTIPVVNNGPGKAAHVTLITQTPANTVFSSFSAPAGWVVYQKPAHFSAGTVSCSAYNLPAGATATFTLSVRVGFSVPPGTQITQSSTVSSFMPDPISANNTATKTFTVQ
jgi:uncharacterized delta-60 repeat protein/uncharacterized repeat protein (TIGR01451 family)